MQHAWLAPVSVVAFVAIAILSSLPPLAGDAVSRDPPSPAAVFETFADPSPVAPETLTGLRPYVDPEFGFSVAVPAGWTASVVPETDAELEMLEPGYAVAFESRAEHERDVFTDYLMIEILPGGEAGLFETDGSRRREIVVDGRPAWRDALSLPADPDDARTVDLVVRQASTSGLGYTIGFYAVARPARAALIEDAFEVMLHTFDLRRRPFDVS